MAEISKITLPSGTTYDIKDASARSAIAALTGGDAVVFVGVSSTALTDGGSQTPTVDGDEVTPAAGQLFFYGTEEFIWGTDSKWHELGSLDSLGDLAYKDAASGSYTPAGTVSQPTFSGSSMTATGTFTPEGGVTVSTKTTTNATADVSPSGSGTATYTPAGSVSAPTISVATAGSTTTVNSITAVGSLPQLTTTVTNETLTIGWDAGTLPTKGDNTTVKTGDAAYSASQPSFSGTGVHLVTGNIAVPATYEASFSGTQGSVSVSGTPEGTVSTPSFSGTAATIEVS